MSEKYINPLGEGLVYEDQVSLGWSESEADLSAAKLVRIHETNEDVLRLISALEEHHADGSDEVGAGGIHDFARLEFKVNLLLEMVGRILSHHTDVPVAVPISLTATGIRWTSPETPPAQDSHIFVEIYFHHKYPQPIILPGKVHTVQSDNGAYTVEVGFEHINEPVQRWLEKLIFRQHRRSIAYSRQHLHKE